VNDSCQAFRIECVSGESAASTHSGQCAECARWEQAFVRQQAALVELARLPAPTELAVRVQAELAGDFAGRTERVLGSLVRRSAPAQLDERVVALLGRSRADDEERGREKAQALRALEVHPAPDVLERLVDEELAHPGQHVAERYPGTLERVSAPPALAKRVAVVVRRRALTRLVLAPLVPLAAAVMVVWLAVDRDDGRPERRFQVVHASSLDQLDPMARALAESLGGGVPR